MSIKVMPINGICTSIADKIVAKMVNGEKLAITLGEKEEEGKKQTKRHTRSGQ